MPGSDGLHNVLMASISDSSLSALPPSSTRGILARVRKTPLGSPDNQLCIGDFVLALHDNVLVIEGGGITCMSELQPSTLRVLLGAQDVLIDMWRHSTCSVSIAASPKELELAHTFFLDHGIAVHQK